VSAGVSGSGAGAGGRAADFDQRGAYLTFEALEKGIIQSDASGGLADYRGTIAFTDEAIPFLRIIVVSGANSLIDQTPY
jgi:hypothetical protein